MDSHGRGLGLEPRAGIELPAPCIGHPRGKPYACETVGSIAQSAMIATESGAPAVALVTCCPTHTRAVRHWLSELGIGDPVETYATSTLAENFDVFEKSGVEPWRLQTA